MQLVTSLYSVCSAVYATLSVLIAIQARERATVALAICCGITSAWAACGAFGHPPVLEGVIGLIDLIRLLIWYCYLLYLYEKSNISTGWQIRLFSAVAAGVFIAGVAVSFTAADSSDYTLYSWPIALRLIISIFELLLIENLYFNLPESARWHIALPCVLLGGLGCFDILLAADTALFRRVSISLVSARVIVMIIVAPLLVLAAFRGQRWHEPVRLSRAAVFHSATLVLSGSVLLSLAFAGEILRDLDQTWGWIAELSLFFLGLICIMLFISSRSAKSLMDRMVVHHFFADRYDYRAQWLSCIGTLSGRGSDEQIPLYTRAIRAVADVVDSPCGTLFIKDDVTGSFNWVGSWNMPASKHLLFSHPLIQTLVDEQRVIEFGPTCRGLFHEGPLSVLGPVWLVVPLLHSTGINGLVIVGPPRVALRIDQEVFDLLGILGQEVGTYVAEQHATEAVVQTRSLHDYGKRFAFVAHDIKNVSSQLALLLSNAEHHLENPEFQRDMLKTVRSSVQKIDRLLNRLDRPSATSEPAWINPVFQLKSLIDIIELTRRSTLTFEHMAPPVWIVIGHEAFDTAMTHLINNAIESSTTSPVHILVKIEGDYVIIEIADHGDGMSAEFIRDELFSPLKTSRAGGSGIGAFQARELITEVGGELLVTSQQGVGTTMSALFKRADSASSPQPQQRLSMKIGGV